MPTARLPQSQPGTVDDLVTEQTALRISQSGSAEYNLVFRPVASPEFAVRLWTAQKGKISTSTIPAEAPSSSQGTKWVLSEEGALLSLEATNCRTHLEHMARNHYWLGIELANGETVHINFTTSGYIKSSMQQGAASGKHAGA